MGHPTQGNRERPRLYNESRYLAAPPPSIGGGEGDQRIVGGTVAEEGEFPWAVALSLGKLLNRALWYNQGRASEAREMVEFRYSRKSKPPGVFYATIK